MNLHQVSRISRHSNSLRQQVVVVLLLLAYLAGSIGIPVPRSVLREPVRTAPHTTKPCCCTGEAVCHCSCCGDAAEENSNPEPTEPETGDGICVLKACPCSGTDTATLIFSF